MGSHLRLAPKDRCTGLCACFPVTGMENLDPDSGWKFRREI